MGDAVQTLEVAECVHDHDETAIVSLESRGWRMQRWKRKADARAREKQAREKYFFKVFSRVSRRGRSKRKEINDDGLMMIDVH